MVKYGFQLTIVELLTIFGIYMIRTIIDYLHDKTSSASPFTLFFWFGLIRFLAILIRNYYDIHVYNFYRYVQTAIQGWILTEVS